MRITDSSNLGVVRDLKDLLAHPPPQPMQKPAQSPCQRVIELICSPPHFLQVVMENNDQQVNLWPCLSTCLLLSQSLGPGEWGAMVGQAWFICPPSCHRLGCKIMRKGMGKQDIQCPVNTIHHRATKRTRLGLYFLDSGRDSGCF